MSKDTQQAAESTLIDTIMNDIAEEALCAGQFDPRVQVLGLNYIRSALRRHLGATVRESGEHKQPGYDSRPDGSGLDDGPALPLSVIMATKRPMIIAAFKEGLSARACARVFGVSHETAAQIVKGMTTQIEDEANHA